MKYARLLVLGVALGAGLIAARLVMNSGTPQPQQSLLPDPVQVAEDEVLVAARDIPLGTKLSKADMKWVAWPRDALPKGVVVKSKSPKAAENYIGNLARSEIYDGEPIRAQRLVDTDQGFMAAMLPKGKRAIAVGVEAETTAGGFILPGDKVDLIMTRKGRGADKIKSETILENIRVLAIDSVTAGEKEQKNLSPKRTATLELTPRQAETVALAQQLGTISLALRSVEDSSDTAESEPARKNEEVNFVKYGVSTQATAE